MGLYQIWKQDVDPTDAVNPYTPYTFPDKIPTYDLGMARREAVMLIPGLDGVVSGYGKRAGPFDRRTLTVGFRVLTKRGPFAAHDLLMAAIMGEENVRLVLKTETGYLRFTNASLLSTSEPHTNDENYYFDFKATWRIRPDWRAQFSEASDVWPSTPEVFDAGSDETFGTGGAVFIASAAQVFNVDLRGTAGSDMATLPTTDGTLAVVGPAGGDGGMSFTNESVLVKDTTGAWVPIFFSMNIKLLTSSDSVNINLASQSFWHNGVPFRPFKPNWQNEYMRYDPNIVNVCVFSALGANPVTGGFFAHDEFRKFA